VNRGGYRMAFDYLPFATKVRITAKAAKMLQMPRFLFGKCIFTGKN
jgi:hypothetical protein